MSKSIKLNNAYMDSSSIVHERKLLGEIINKLKYYKSSTSNVTYSTSSSWTWLNVANPVTINENGIYLCLFVAWVSNILGSEMDLRFTVNGQIQGKAGNALGNKATAFDILSVNKNSVVSVSMQTSSTGTTVFYDPNLILIKIS